MINNFIIVYPSENEYCFHNGKMITFLTAFDKTLRQYPESYYPCRYQYHTACLSRTYSLLEQHHAQQRGAEYAKAGPHGVRGAERQRLFFM